MEFESRTTMQIWPFSKDLPLIKPVKSFLLTKKYLLRYVFGREEWGATLEKS